MCQDYLSSGPPDMTIVVAPEDIDFEKEKSDQEHKIENIPVPAFSAPYLETLAVYRKIAEKMPDWDTFLFHGSCVAAEGKAYLFTAKSGTGKSTHTRLWRKLLGEKAVMVNDDKPLIRVTEEGPVIYGTPWDGKHHLSANVSVPLQAICILERDETNHIQEITKQEALPMLIQQAYRPASAQALVKTLDLINRMEVRLYRLGCNMDISAAQLSYQTMKEESK